MSEKIWLSSPHMSDEGFELEYVKDAFEKNWIAPLGENVNKFEEELSSYVGVEGAVALSSGTAALHLALRAAGVKEGDIVFCQSLTFSATANPILYEKAIPVFIDSDYETWNMDPDALEEAFKKYPNVKAVMVVHLYGLSADMDRIVELCEKYDVALIEDAAESLGTTYKGKQSGTMGDFGIYSFNGNKIITTSGGGMLVSHDKSKTDKARFWATQSREPERHYEHKELGFNYRMSNIVAGIGRGQLKVLDDRVKKKQDIYNRYKEAFSDIEEIEMMPMNEWNKPNCWLSSMTVKGNIKPIDIMLALEKQNIESRPLWKPMHLQPFFKEYDFIGEGVSDDLFNRGICLPSDTKMTNQQQDKVIKIIRELYNA